MRTCHCGGCNFKRGLSYALYQGIDFFVPLQTQTNHPSTCYHRLTSSSPALSPFLHATNKGNGFEGLFWPLRVCFFSCRYSWIAVECSESICTSMSIYWYLNLSLAFSLYIMYTSSTFVLANNLIPTSGSVVSLVHIMIL